MLYLVGSLYAAISLIPILWMISGSLKSKEDFQTNEFVIFPSAPKFENFVRLFDTFDFGIYLQNTFVVTVSVVIMSLAVNSMAAYSLARLKFPGRNFVFLTILSAMMIPFASYMVPLFIVFKELHLVNSLWGIILQAVVNPFVIFLLRQFYIGFPRELEEAGKIDGLNLASIYFRLVVPTSKPIFVTVSVLVFIWNWNNYVWPLIIVNDSSKWILQLGIASFMGEHATEFEMIMAGSFVATLPVIILFFALQRYLIEGIIRTGIKG